MTSKELEARVKALEDKLAQMQSLGAPAVLTVSDVKVGESFVYAGHKYTKLNESNYCIIDDYDKSFMRCMFDPISNDYRESIIRNYINSDRFIERLGVNREHLRPHYDEDLIALLSKEEYESYRHLIKDYNIWWATRSAYSNYTYGFCFVDNIGFIISSNVYNTFGARVGFELAPDTPVDRKGNDEED